jgi:hypothetical protein
MPAPQNQQDDGLEPNPALETPASTTSGGDDENDRHRSGFSSWSLEVACAHAQRW